MNPSPKVSAAAAKEAYADHLSSDIDNNAKQIFFGHQRYVVFGYTADSATGFHATAYRNKETNEIIIAYRGTDPDIQHHTRTTIQDAAVDFTMVKDQVNPQKNAADAFTRAMIDKAARHGISRDHITVTGHSLGGTLAEIEAAEFGLRGTTFNAYGAVDLGYGVSEGGTHVTNYVMAGDVVSAASRHHGQIVPLASDDDILALKTGRYLDAAQGAPPPNPLMAMMLSDHSVTHFVPEPGSPDASALDPGMLAHYEKNYADNKAAIDRYRHDVYEERAELAAALRHADSHDLASTWKNLPPRIQQQLAELHAREVDAPIHSAVAHGAVVQGVEHGLEQTGTAMRTSGQTVHELDERMAAGVRHASIGMAPAMPAAPLADMALAEGMHLHGELAQAASQLAEEQMKQARQTVQLGAHAAAEAATTAVHGIESVALTGADLAINTYQGGKAALEHTGHAYEAARRTVSQGADAIAHGAQRAGEALHAFAEHTGAAYAESAMLRGQAISATADALMHRPPSNARTGATAPNHHDPRHPGNSLHGLYNELHWRIPDAGEQRLLQFTAACHAHHIGAHNLGAIHLDEARATMHFNGNDIWARPVSVNFSQPSPPPEQSIQHIQQHDQQQAQLMGQIHTRNQAQQQQGPAPGGPIF